MDVIAAISTAPALSAIGIVRVSGEGCFALCDKIFRPLSGRAFSAARPREMILGRLLDREGASIDSCLAVRFPGPGSYTGEDCAEFHCHGSPVVLEEALASLFAAGAGALIVGNRMSGREYLGCGLMLAAVVLAQLPGAPWQRKNPARESRVC